MKGPINFAIKVHRKCV